MDDIAGTLISQRVAETAGSVCLFEPLLGENALRELVNALTPNCGLAAAFSGSDEEGYRYVIGSRTLDLRAISRELNARISGRGGGRPEMIQGSAAASEAEIRRAIAEIKQD